VVLGRRTAVFLTPLNLGPKDVGKFLKDKSSFLTHEFCKRFVDGFHLESYQGRLSKKIVSVFQVNPCQDVSVIGRDSVLQRDLRRSVQVLVDDDIQESLRGWARGFCNKCTSKLSFTWIQVFRIGPDSIKRECPSVRALRLRSPRPRTALLGKLASSVSMVVIHCWIPSGVRPSGI